MQEFSLHNQCVAVPHCAAPCRLQAPSILSGMYRTSVINFMTRLTILQLLAGMCPCAEGAAHMERSVSGTALVYENVTYRHTRTEATLSIQIDAQL